MYTGNATLKSSGALSVAVPGELAGLHQAWKLYGRLPWKSLVKPAEILARNGFKISPYLHMQMVKTESGIMSDVGLCNLFTSRGALLELGHLCRNQKLAKTLQEISEHGVEAFYNGSVGLNLVKDVKKAGGILTMEDLRRYQVKLREAISADILGLKVLGMPPPSSGGAAMILVRLTPTTFNVETQTSFYISSIWKISVFTYALITILYFCLTFQKLHIFFPKFYFPSKILIEILSSILLSTSNIGLILYVLSMTQYFLTVPSLYTLDLYITIHKLYLAFMYAEAPLHFLFGSLCMCRKT